MFKNLFHTTKSVPSSNTLHSKCVCQVCNCGKHRCPTHANNMPGDFMSTFQHDYKPWKPCREKPYNFDRTPQQHCYDPDTLQSQYQSEYINRPLPIKEPRNKLPLQNTGPFYDSSDYRTNFKKYPLPVKRPKLPPKLTPSQRVAPWSSTYNADFLRFPTGENDCIRPQVMDGPEMQPEFGTTTYKTSYIPKYIGKPQKCIDPPQRNLYGDNGKMGNSTYQVDYQELPKLGEPCPVESMPKRPKMLTNGQSHLNYNAYINQWG